jgi:SAM-dependent methyltransferase
MSAILRLSRGHGTGHVSAVSGGVPVGEQNADALHLSCRVGSAPQPLTLPRPWSRLGPTMQRRKAKRSPTSPVDGQTAADVIERRREIWAERPLTRAVYGRAFSAIARELAAGRHTVEIGGGTGMAREFLRDVLVTDLVPTRHVDLVANAVELPFPAANLDNLIGIDCLHHLPRPALLFEEATRVLRPGGRLVLLEPFISPVSRVVFALGHPEPVDLAVDPLPSDGRPVFAESGPFAANQAIPTLLFFRQLHRFETRFPLLRVCTRRRMSVVAYPLSGGFSGPRLVPGWAHVAVWTLERLAAPLAPFMAFQLLITLERMTGPPSRLAVQPAPAAPPMGK